MDNKNYNLEGPLQENATEKSSKDKIVEDVKLLFNDVKDTKINIDKIKLIDKMNLILRILLGLVSLSICVLTMVEMIYVDMYGLIFGVPCVIVCFACSMILFFSKKKSIYKIITIILLLFLFAIEVFNACCLYPYIF